MSMSGRLLRVPEVARALDLEGEQVYALIDRGELKAGKGQDGLVYVPQQALEEYRQRRATASR
jgi:Helix-turn-helix domain